MFLKPSGKCDLEHRAYFLRGIVGHSAVVAASEEGYISVFNSKFMPLQRNRLATKLQAISPHPRELFLAWANGDSGSLVVQHLTGDPVTEVLPPQRRKDASKWTKQGFDDCCFDERGKFLWAVGPINDHEIELQLVDTRDWSTVQKAVIEDQFGSSSCSLHCTGNPAVVALWIAAGQDGQQVVWVKRRGYKFFCEPVEQLVNTTPPVFSPDGSSLIVLNAENSICKYEFPSMKRIGTRLESKDEDNPFAESMCFMDHRHVLASTAVGRIFLLDTDRMRTMEEVELEGHEPRPIGEYYPSLAKESRLATDISWFARLGKAVVFVFRRDRGTGLKGWKDSLLWYSVKD